MSKQQKGTSNKDKGANPNILRRALDGVDIRPTGLLNLGLKSWQTALDRSRSIARLAERHNHYSDFSRNLAQSHVVPLSMPRLDMRVVSRYLRLDTAFRPLERTMRMKRQPEQAPTQARSEATQRFRPTLPNPNDFRRSNNIIERLLEPESPTYYDEPEGFYAEQFEDNYQEQEARYEEQGARSKEQEDFRSSFILPPSSFEPQSSVLSLQSSPALARALDRIDTPLTVNNPYAAEVGAGQVAPSFEAVSPVEMVYRTQEQGTRSQESGTAAQPSNLARTVNPEVSPYREGRVTSESPSSFIPRPSSFETQSTVHSPQSSPALGRAMERMDTPLTVNNPAAQQVAEPVTPVFGNFEVATPASPVEMVYRTQEQGARSKEQEVRGEARSQESGVRSQNLGGSAPPASPAPQSLGYGNTAPQQNERAIVGDTSSSFESQPSAPSTQPSPSPAIMRAMERMDSPLTVNNIFAEPPAELPASSGNFEAASPVEMVYRTESKSQESGSLPKARSQNTGASQNLTTLPGDSRTAPTEFSDNRQPTNDNSLSSFTPHASSFEPPALARALERIDTPITVNNVFAEQPGERPASPALEAAAASSPAMIHRAQEQAARSQESSGQPTVRSQEQGARSQNLEAGRLANPNIPSTPEYRGQTGVGVASESPSSFILHPSSFESQSSPALARALERIDTPITVNNVYAEQPGERPVSHALEAATASSPAMIHRSQEQAARNKEQEVRTQNTLASELVTPNLATQKAGETSSSFILHPSSLETQSSPALARAIERLIEQSETGFARLESGPGLTQRVSTGVPTNGDQPMLETAAPAMVHRTQEQGARSKEQEGSSAAGATTPKLTTQKAGEVPSSFIPPPSSFEAQSSPALARAIQRLEEQIAAEESRTEDGFLMANPPAQAAELVVPPLLLRKAGEYVPETRDENRITRTEETSPFAAPAPQSLAEALEMLHVLPSMRETAKQNGGNSVARQVAGDNGAATQPSALSPQSLDNNPILNAVMRSMDSGVAKPLDGGVHSRLSGMFGRNFEHVRVHTDDHAAEATSHMGAEAFTVGQSIFFAPGRYRPETPEGQALIGHELTHIIQNATLPSLGNGRVLEASSDHQHLEREAQQVERTILRHLDPTPYTPIQTNVSRSYAAPTPAPAVERSITPVEPVHLRSADSGAIARQPEPGSYIEREIGSYNSIQRAVQIDEMNVPADGANGQQGGKMDDEELAEKVFKLIKERLLIERERHGLRGGSYF